MDVPQAESRWIIYDLEWVEPDGRLTSKVIYISYAPEGASMKQKVFIAVEKNKLYKMLKNIAM